MRASWVADIVLKTRPSGGGVAVVLATVIIIAFGRYRVMKISMQRIGMNGDELSRKSPFQYASAA